MIVLHIGMPKAGSATIQSYLDENQLALRRLSVDYPRPGRAGSKNHGAIIKDLGLPADKVLSGKKLSALISRIESKPFRTTIISAEMLSRLNKSHIYKFRRVLSRSERPIRVIMIIRDLADQIVSMYGQKIRHGNNTYDFDTFFEMRIDDIRCNLFAIASLWAAEFGWEAMRVRALDRGHLLNGDLIDDFLACSGLDPDSPELRSLPRSERVNESSGWKCLEAGRALFSGNHRLNADHPLAQVMSSVRLAPDKTRVLRDMRLIEEHSADIARDQGWAAEKGRYLTYAQSQRCLDAYGGAIRDLNRFLETPLPEPANLEDRGFVAREFLPDASHIEPYELANHYCELGSRLVADGLLGKVTKGDLKDMARRHRNRDERSERSNDNKTADLAN